MAPFFPPGEGPDGIRSGSREPASPRALAMAGVAGSAGVGSRDHGLVGWVVNAMGWSTVATYAILLLATGLDEGAHRVGVGLSCVTWERQGRAEPSRKVGLL